MKQAPGPWFLGLLSAAFYLFIQFQSPFLYDGDAYFHVKIAALFAREGPVGALPWMAFTIHAERYVDFHFLYHALLAPFTLVFEPITAAKVSAAIFAGFSAGCFALLIERSVPRRYLWFWVVLFLCASPVFTGRLMFGRTTTLFLGLVFLFWRLLATERPRSAGLLAALGVWTYPGFPLLLAIAAVFLFARRMRQGEWTWSIVLYPGGGVALAFVFHPAFPHHFYGYYLEWVVHALSPAGLEVIGEWLPPPWPLALLALTIPGLLALGGCLRRAEWQALDLSVAVIAVLLAVATARSMKAIEYLAPVLLLLGALRWHGVPEVALRIREAAGVGVLLLVLVVGLPDIYSRTQAQARLLNPRPAFAAADWLAARAAPDELVLLPWDEFPYFFFRNDRNRYPLGLNPVYAYGADSNRYLALSDFFRGRGPDPLQIVRETGPGFAVLRKLRDAAGIRRLHGRPGVRRVYQNERFVIYEIETVATSTRSRLPDQTGPGRTSSP